jgi:hypothetical protein
LPLISLMAAASRRAMTIVGGIDRSVVGG